MNYIFCLTASDPAAWASAQDSLWYYLEEAALRKTSLKLEWIDGHDEAQPGRESPNVLGFRVKLPRPDLDRALDIMAKAHFSEQFHLQMMNYPILPQDDPDEQAIQKRLASGKLPTQTHSVEAPVVRPQVTATTIEVKSNPGIDETAG